MEKSDQFCIDSEKKRKKCFYFEPAEVSDSTEYDVKHAECFNSMLGSDEEAEGA